MLFISAIRLHRTCPRFWGPNRETCCCPVLRSKPVNLLPPSFVAWIGKPASSDVDVCPASAKFWRLQVFHAPAAWVAYSSLSPPSSLTWPPMTLSGLLRSLGPSLLMFTIHRPLVRRHEPFAWPSPHPLTATSHDAPVHHEPRDTSNLHNIINHSWGWPLLILKKYIWEREGWKCI